VEESLYPRELVKPMADELNAVNVRSLTDAGEVDELLSRREGTALVVINSVCGCAAGQARPGVALALQHHTIPDELVTVFAGVDRGATERARAYMGDLPPSSPCVALFRDGELVHALPRERIERLGASEVAADLSAAFDRACSRKGPSVPTEEFEQLDFVRRCGSQIEWVDPAS